MLAKKTSKNQITLPKTIADNFVDTVYFDVVMQDNQIVLRPVTVSPSGANLNQVRSKMKKLGITEKDVKEAITWARKSAG
jgi:hypothetical protein